MHFHLCASAAASLRVHALDRRLGQLSAIVLTKLNSGRAIGRWRSLIFGGERSVGITSGHSGFKFELGDNVRGGPKEGHFFFCVIRILR